MSFPTDRISQNCPGARLTYTVDLRLRQDKHADNEQLG